MSEEIHKTAEDYLRGKYGASRGSFSWRDEEKAFNAGLLAQSDRIKELESQLEEAKKDQARYQYVIDWLESNVIATAAFTHARTKSEYDQAIDAATKEQQ